MRDKASRRGNAVPTWEQLEAMLAATNGMICKDCGRPMGWLRHDLGPSQQLTLQHYRNGSMALVCLACNTRHAKMPGDSFLQLPKGHKRCPACAETKPLSEFKLRKCTSTGKRIPQSRCRPCDRAYDRDHQRAAYARKRRAEAQATVGANGLQQGSDK